MRIAARSVRHVRAKPDDSGEPNTAEDKQGIVVLNTV
ncbi:hypothetical protein DEV91_10732 [Phyllobacterium brassicacearum]|nr:hypothetical protein DEV91_10732 [Phyllobacterium brassicacearum]